MTPTSSLDGVQASDRILVVDDHEINRVLLQEILQQQGYRIDVARDGLETLRAVAETQPDLVLLDVNMPGMDGFEVCRRLRAAVETRGLPIILVTALADREQRLEGIAAGANDYLTKPIDRADLLLRVRNALRMRSLHREVEAQYHQLQRLEQLRDSLVHMLVHDLRTPLTGIRGYLELARMRVAELSAPDVLRDLDEMELSVVELTDMVSDVLDVSRFEAEAMPLSLVSTDLRALAEEAVVAVGRPRHATVELAGSAKAVPIVADATLIRRVITNLVGNAVKFSPRDGIVRVETESSAEGAHLRVVDNGRGIPAEHHERIFDKFGQVGGSAASPVRSSGLGLAYCKLAVQAHGGHIGVSSEVGQGSTFWFVLPVSA
ncbi:MAG TPA: hybrid sensor histidine kinase/response regulator [Gemmatimonadales bacterium]|nr:hybrid sensor histidine kinase/response regulator [Gemmatimonadales bacterium]